MSGVRRSHVSSKNGLVAIEPRDQECGPAMKPKGFWYEVNGDWRRWCAGEMPDWIAGRDLYRVVLGDERMVELRTVADMDAFVAEYHVSEARTSQWGPWTYDRGIRWDRVAERYDGIEIAPYVQVKRLRTLPGSRDYGMTYPTAILAAAIAFCLGLALTAHRAREAWERGRRSGLKPEPIWAKRREAWCPSCGAFQFKGYPHSRVGCDWRWNEYDVTGIGS